MMNKFVWNSVLFSVMVFKNYLFPLNSIVNTKVKDQLEIWIVYNSSDTVIMFYCYDWYWLALLRLFYQNEIQCEFGFAFPYETLTRWCYFFPFVLLRLFLFNRNVEQPYGKWSDEHISRAYVYERTFAHQNNHKQLQWMAIIIIYSYHMNLFLSMEYMVWANVEILL